MDLNLPGSAHEGCGLHVDGRWSAGSGEPIVVVDPSTGERFASIASARPDDVATAAAAATRAFAGWRRLAGAERAVFLDGFAAGLQAHEATLVALQMRNNGKPEAEARTDVADAVATFRYYAGLARELDGRQRTPVPLSDGFAGHVRFEAVGPVGMIVPWNFPLVTSAWKIAPALAAGCTVVLKTSEYTPLVERVYPAIAEAIGLPPGVLNLVTGAGAVGAAITAEPRFAKLSFTGSNAVGARVMAAAAARCVPVSLELGGKSPILVFDDADIAVAVDAIVGGVFYNAGQMCSATSRLLVQRSIAPRLVDALVAATESLVVGAPSQPGTTMGPLAHAPQHARVCAVLARARQAGVRTLAGGAPIARPGFFVQPTVYDEVATDDPLWTDEIFGPVLALRRFDTEDEAVALANDSAFGLVATVIGTDPDRLARVADRLEAGHVWINSLQVIHPQSAWGGFKRSGIGRELGPWGLSAYLGVKHITAARR